VLLQRTRGREEKEQISPGDRDFEPRESPSPRVPDPSESGSFLTRTPTLWVGTRLFRRDRTLSRARVSRGTDATHLVSGLVEV